MPTRKEIRFELKKFELNGIRVIQHDYEEHIRETLLGIEKISSKDYFELSRIRVKQQQLYMPQNTQNMSEIYVPMSIYPLFC